MIAWHWRSFEELNKQELYDILALRQEVFVFEQRSLYIDLDYVDQKAMHLLGMQDKKLATYLRLIPADILYPGAVSFGRVVTAPFARKQGLAKMAVEKALLYLKNKDNKNPIIISAQLYLRKFYESFCFEVSSEPYDEDGIMHIKMIKQDSNAKK